MSINAVVSATPNYVLLDRNQRIGPKLLRSRLGLDCFAIYGFSDKGPYDEFCTNTDQKLTPYPLVKGYLRNQVGALGDRLRLVVLDAPGPTEPCIHAATMEAVLEAQEKRASQVAVTYRLILDREADAYRVEEADAYDSVGIVDHAWETGNIDTWSNHSTESRR